jgi:hypothetical protein
MCLTGKGHLACISFAGGRPMDRRRPILIGSMPRCEEDRNVRDDIKFLSHYNRARAAALGPGTSLDTIKGDKSSKCKSCAAAKADDTEPAAAK